MTVLRSRRLLVVLALALVLAACGGGGGDDAAAEAPAAPSGSDHFPVTIKHTFGSTTIAEAPQRIVTVGFSDQDTFVALGVVPVALRDWYGDQPNGVWPWAHDLLEGAEPIAMAGELNYEQIAAADPDVIVELYGGLEEPEYELLAQIAPTVARPADHPAWGAPWDVMTRVAGQVTGKVEEADALIADLEATFDATREAHPEFEGVGFVYAGVYGEQQVYAESSDSTRVKNFEALGFVVPEEINALDSSSFSIDISAERLDLLDHDVLLWELSNPAMTGFVRDDPLVQGLDVMRAGRGLVVDDPIITGALAHGDVLSIPYFLDELVPLLADAVGRLG